MRRRSVYFSALARNMTRKIRTIVVDDEPLARSNLTISLRRDPEIEIVAECDGGAEAIGRIRTSNPDLIFLDVQMPECDGFDVVESLGIADPPVIIFVTAYDDYAVRAFEAGAIDYLLKPFNDARFELALGRAKERISQCASRKPSRIAVKFQRQLLFVDTADIDWIEAADYYTCLHAGTKSYLLRRSIAELERDLSPETFCRIHRSTIVNLKRVEGLGMNRAGSCEVMMSGGTRLRVSEGYRKNLQSRLALAR